MEILKRYPHIRWWSRPNKGAYATMNEGLAAAQGEFVTLINADDKYASPQAIASAMKIFIDGSRYDVVYGKTVTIDEKGKPYLLEGPQYGPLWCFRYYSGAIAHNSLIVRTKIIQDRNIYFNLALIYSADHEWINQLIETGMRFCRLRKPIGVFRFHAEQRTNDPMSATRIAEYESLRRKYPRNSFINYLVRQWVTLVRIKNCYTRAGLKYLLKEGRSWIKRRCCG